jgi:hypothetical protein
MPHSCSATTFSKRECPGGGCVDVYPPRHSARPFHHIRSSIACLHPPHPPITLAPAALPPAVRATSFAPFPRPLVPPPLLLSSDRLRPFPRSLVPPSLLLLCALLCVPLHSIAYCTARPCPQRPEGTQTTSRSDLQRVCRRSIRMYLIL